VNFVLSPDGMWLALEPRQKEDKLTLFYKGENDTPWIVPSNPKETYSPIVGSMAWSPNGTRLAFASYELGDKIHVVDVHTKQEWSIPIYPSARSPHFLSWSPDGNIVAFAARNERTWKDNLYIVNVDGSHLRNLSRDESLYVRNPTWSPNGRYIFYSEYSDKDFTRRPRLEVTSQ
jgi:Tol biopolymer transport system component